MENSDCPKRSNRYFAFMIVELYLFIIYNNIMKYNGRVQNENSSPRRILKIFKAKYR